MSRDRCAGAAFRRLPPAETKARLVRGAHGAIPSVIATPNRKPSKRDATARAARRPQGRSRAASWSAGESGGIAWLGDRPGELRDRHELIAARAQRIDDDRQRRDGLAPVATGIVEQNDIAAALGVGLDCRRSMARSRYSGHHIVDDRRDARTLPVLAVDMEPDRDIAAVLRLQHREDLVGRASARHRRRRARGTASGSARERLEQALGGVQLEQGLGLADGREFGMRIGVAPDFMALADHALEQAALGKRIFADDEEGRRTPLWP